MHQQYYHLSISGSVMTSIVTRFPLKVVQFRSDATLKKTMQKYTIVQDFAFQIEPFQ